MSEWLLAISIGPVGDFIGGGRRSRDLWWGSTWVSECSLKVAEVLAGRGMLLIPRPERVVEIREDMKKNRRTYEGRISNKVLAKVEMADPDLLAQLARECELAACDHLASQLERALDHRGGILPKAIEVVVEKKAFKDQIEAIRKGDFVEFFAAWTPNQDSHADEQDQQAIERVWQLLSARKTARFFQPPHWTRAGQRKSDLDAGRDSVLKAAPESQESRDSAVAERRLARRRLGITPNEELDAVGVGRRIAAFTHGPELKPLPFPPLCRVAIDPWLHRIVTDASSRRALAKIEKQLGRADQDELFFVWCSPARDPRFSAKQSPSAAEAEHLGRTPLFEYDGAFLLEGGLEALWRDLDRLTGNLEDDGAQKQVRHLRALTRPVRHLHEMHDVPPPYYALLSMDGDGVGQAMARDRDRLSELVKALDDFADSAEKVVRRHHGCAFYVGGDELIAYLPIDTAFNATLALARLFDKLVAPKFSVPVSLSGGLVLAHVKADLRGVRRQAQEALHEAKRARHEAALAKEKSEPGWLEIREQPRGGTERVCRERLHSLVERLQNWKDLLDADVLSLRTAQMLFDLSRRFGDWKQKGGGTLGRELAQHRVLAQLGRSSKVGEDDPSEHLKEKLRSRLAEVKTWQDTDQLMAELKVGARYQRIAALRPTGGGGND